MTLLLNPAPAWRPSRSDEIVLWHGCTNTDFNSIRNGINLAQCRVDADFGRGFYMTTIERQARHWAWIRFWSLPPAGRRRNYPVILEFRVDRVALGQLVSLAFVIGDYDSLDYWSLVQRCRQSTPYAPQNHLLPGGQDWYDLVSGPVAADWRQRACLHDADQFSFHTPRGISLLKRPIKTRI